MKNLVDKERIVVTDTGVYCKRIRNATMVKHQIVQIPATKCLYFNRSRYLEKRRKGFIEDFES
jgi:ribosomal protein S8